MIITATTIIGKLKQLRNFVKLYEKKTKHN